MFSFRRMICKKDSFTPLILMVYENKITITNCIFYFFRVFQTKTTLNKNTLQISIGSDSGSSKNLEVALVALIITSIIKLI